MNLKTRTDRQGKEQATPELKMGGIRRSLFVPSAVLLGCFCIFCLVTVLIVDHKWGFIARIESQVSDQHVKNIFVKGSSLVKQGRSQEAIAVYRQAFDRRPEIAALAHANIAAVYGLHGRWDEAAQEYQEALRLDPQCAMALVGLGSVSYFRGNYEEAVRYFSNVLERDQKSLGAYFARADSFFRLEKFDDAKKDYEKFLELDPQNEKAHEVHNKLGMALARQNKFDEAMAEFQKSLSMNAAYAPAKKNVEEVLEFMKTTNINESRVGTRG